MVDELNVHGKFSSFPSPIHHMNVFCNEEDMGFQGLDWQMQRYITPPINGTNNLSTLKHNLFCFRLIVSMYEII